MPKRKKTSSTSKPAQEEKEKVKERTSSHGERAFSRKHYFASQYQFEHRKKRDDDKKYNPVNKDRVLTRTVKEVPLKTAEDLDKVIGRRRRHSNLVSDVKREKHNELNPNETDQNTEIEHKLQSATTSTTNLPSSSKKEINSI